jgi:DNA modification methylase
VIKLILGDALMMLKTLPANSIHSICTSPPYFQQRDYQIDGQIGLEVTVEEFIDKLVAVFMECHRVLHKTGTMWINIGDSYASGGNGGNGGGGAYMKERKSWGEKVDKRGFRKTPGLKHKDLCGVPWRLALALQSAGWYLRNDNIWHKTSAFPESCVDRSSKAHEYVFLLTKRPTYYYDQDAVREPTGNECDPDEYEASKVGSYHDHSNDEEAGMLQPKVQGFKAMTHPLGRNRRTVWSIAGEPFKGGHFAVMPTALAEICIKAGSSEKGCCPQCLAPWIRVKEGAGTTEHGGKRKRADAPGAEVSPSSVFRTGKIQIYKTVAWAKSCKCESLEPIPCIILDCFSGAGTTGLVASRLFRSYIGIELSPVYLEMSERRIRDDRPLFNVIVKGMLTRGPNGTD